MGHVALGTAPQDCSARNAWCDGGLEYPTFMPCDIAASVPCTCRPLSDQSVCCHVFCSDPGSSSSSSSSRRSRSSSSGRSVESVSFVGWHVTGMWRSRGSAAQKASENTSQSVCAQCSGAAGPVTMYSALSRLAVICDHIVYSRHCSVEKESESVAPRAMRHIALPAR